MGAGVRTDAGNPPAVAQPKSKSLKEKQTPARAGPGGAGGGAGGATAPPCAETGAHRPSGPGEPEDNGRVQLPLVTFVSLFTI